MTDLAHGSVDAAPVGDPGSCRAAAAVLTAQLGRLQQAASGCSPPPDVARIAQLGMALAAALTAYADDLRRAQHRYAGATRAVDRHAALALAARARRRLRLACAEIARAALDMPASPTSESVDGPDVAHRRTAADTVSP